MQQNIIENTNGWSSGHIRFPGEIVTNSLPGFIGIDCLSLPQKLSGAAYYIYHLTINLLIQPRIAPLAIFCTSKHQHLFEKWLKPGDKIIIAPLKNRVVRLLFYEFKLRSLLIKENIKVFYATHYLCPKKSKTYYLINTFHDMGFLLFPQYYPLIKRIYFGKRMKTFLKRADKIVAVSQSTAKGIQQLFPDYTKKITVIKPGTDHLLTSNPKVKFEPKVKTPFILAVNTFEIRKNIPFIIRVFNHLKKRFNFKHKLLLIGQPANGTKAIINEIKHSPFKNDIVTTNDVSSEELKYYYNHCDFFINASVYEGFGFTPFEAINQKSPVFLYKNNTVREFFGNHPYFMENLNVEEWAQTIWTAMNSTCYQLYPNTLKNLTWQNTAKLTLKLLYNVVSTKKVNFVS